MTKYTCDLAHYDRNQELKINDCDVLKMNLFSCKDKAFEFPVTFIIEYIFDFSFQFKQTLNFNNKKNRDNTDVYNCTVQ